MSPSINKRAIIPADLQGYYDDWQMSPGLACDGFVFFTGFTGAHNDGHLSDDSETQIRDAFKKVESVFTKGGMTFADVVEMTSYHVGLRGHLDLFKTVRADYVEEPYSAWTAIEVVGFVREDAIVELRVIARKLD